MKSILLLGVCCVSCAAQFIANRGWQLHDAERAQPGGEGLPLESGNEVRLSAARGVFEVRPVSGEEDAVSPLRWRMIGLAFFARPKWLDGIGGSYIDGRQIPADQVEKKIGGMDFILDASGVAVLEFNLLDALALNGMYVVTGIPAGDRQLQIPGAELIRQLVLDNQIGRASCRVRG